MARFNRLRFASLALVSLMSLAGVSSPAAYAGGPSLIRDVFSYFECAANALNRCSREIVRLSSPADLRNYTRVEAEKYCQSVGARLPTAYQLLSVFHGDAISLTPRPGAVRIAGLPQVAYYHAASDTQEIPEILARIRSGSIRTDRNEILFWAAEAGEDEGTSLTMLAGQPQRVGGANDQNRHFVVCIQPVGQE